MANQEYLIVEHLSIKEIACIFSHIKITATRCWEWQAGRSGKYGKIKFRSRTELVHRVFYAWLIGPLPKRIKGQRTQQLDHLVCNNPPCCNPAHLKLVAPKENILRSDKAPAGVNARKTHCRNEHPLPIAPSGKGTYGRDCNACHRNRYHNESPEKRLHRQQRIARNFKRRYYGLTQNASTER